MLTCKDASRLVSEQQDRKLSRRERLGLALHLWICKSCKQLQNQIRYIRHSMQTGSKQGHLPTDTPLPPDSAERIRKALQAGQQQDQHDDETPD